jgi:acetolactate decarboxylase
LPDGDPDERSGMPVDTALIGALHVEYLGEQGLRGDEHPHHTLFQTSTIEALLDGNYEGDVTFAELEEHGDFGLGTFDALDGEMICLDGEFYRVRADGRAYAVERGARTPFAVVTFFEPDLLLPLTGLEDFAALCEYLDREVGDRAVCHAVRVDGHFDYVKTRSVPRQEKPFPPLVEVVENQPTFEFRGLRGSLAGFRFPDRVGGLNVTGYHFHFVSEDRSVGGHLLECRISRGELRVDHEGDLRLELPAGVSAASPGMTAAQEDAVKRAERG